MNKSILWLAIVCLGMVGCQQNRIPAKISDPAVYEAFLRNPEHHLLAVREHRDIRFSVQYFPPAWQDWKAREAFNSVGSEDKPRQSAVFILNIGPAADAKTGDVMTYGVSNMEEYAERMEQMNFRLEESLELRVGDERLKPSLVHMENTYGLINDRNVHLVFEGAGLGNPHAMVEDLDLVLDDPVYGTGINHFRIPREALNSLPTFEF